ncbi:MAG: hypothetical protein M3401_18045 [Actinomycetota bacterium]|nr:hypothetical protein [Actinomycetota bacterium]
MRFGKRRGKEGPDGDAAVEAPPAPDSVSEDWFAPGHDARQPDHRTPPPDQAAAAPEPLYDPEPLAPEPEAVVEGEAVELPYEPPIAEEPAPEPVAAMPDTPVYEPPAPHPVEPAPAVRLADSTPHHEPGVNPGSRGAWPEPAFDLADRPEILVSAAFGGGILLALILRRLGN